jgi:hypothetical protein
MGMLIDVSIMLLSLVLPLLLLLLVVSVTGDVLAIDGRAESGMLEVSRVVVVVHILIIWLD